MPIPKPLAFQVPLVLASIPNCILWLLLSYLIYPALDAAASPKNIVEVLPPPGVSKYILALSVPPTIFKSVPS